MSPPVLSSRNSIQRRLPYQLSGAWRPCSRQALRSRPMGSDGEASAFHGIAPRMTLRLLKRDLPEDVADVSGPAEGDAAHDAYPGARDGERGAGTGEHGRTARQVSGELSGHVHGDPDPADRAAQRPVRPALDHGAHHGGLQAEADARDAVSGDGYGDAAGRGSGDN